MKNESPVSLGNKYGRLVVLSLHHKRIYNKVWFCRCDCGGSCVVAGDKLKSGHTKSCGCLQKERTSAAKIKHGFCKKGARHKLYAVWQNMKNRCLNPNVQSYKNYGGRGISVCHEWVESFDCFASWAIKKGWDESLEIDRIDNNGSYCAENCHFISPEKNQLNTRRSLASTARKCRESGIDYLLVKDRLRNGWSLERAMTTPKRKRAKNAQ